MLLGLNDGALIAPEHSVGIACVSKEQTSYPIIAACIFRCLFII